MIRSNLDELLLGSIINDTLAPIAPAAQQGMRLPQWHADPVARRYARALPSQQLTVRHQTFRYLYLYRNASGEGGAVLLVTEQRTVLAMDYADTAELDACWRDSVRHYASGIAITSVKLA